VTILLQSGPFALFFAFAIVHALADFPLQGDYLAKVKQRAGASSFHEWFMALTAHSLIHAGGVWVITGSVLYGLAEFVLHWVIDFGKGEGRYGFIADQLLHLGCKVVFVILMAAGFQG
jgi:hypothetical protein